MVDVMLFLSAAREVRMPPCSGITVNVVLKSVPKLDGGVVRRIDLGARPSGWRCRPGLGD
jgi:hypothetical protein